MTKEDLRQIQRKMRTKLRPRPATAPKSLQVDLEVSLITLHMPKGKKSRYVRLSEQAKTILRSFDSLLRSACVFPERSDG